ncbi:MAG: helix-turn-helix transcriptional regulator [Bacteroidota bacterium]
MKTYIILGFINIFLMYFQALRFKSSKYFMFFYLWAFCDPLMVIYQMLFKSTSFYYKPIFIAVLTFGLPGFHKKNSFIIVIISLLGLPLAATYPFIYPFFTAAVNFIIIYHLIDDLTFHYKNSYSLPIFLLLTIFSILFDSMKTSLYYVSIDLFLKLFLLSQIISLAFVASTILVGANKLLKIKNLVKENLPQRSSAEFEVELKSNNYPNIDTIDLHSHLSALTNAELRVFKLLGEGYKCTEVANKLFLSRKTVYFHCNNLKTKLNITSISGLTRYSIENREKVTKTYNPGQSASTEKRKTSTLTG